MSNISTSKQAHQRTKLILAGLGVTGCLALSLAYFAFTPAPPWLDKLLLFRDLPSRQRSVAFFFLELAALLTALMGAIHSRRKSSGSVSRLPWPYRAMAVGIIFLGVSTYTGYRIGIGDNAGSRISYACFTVSFLLLWVYSLTSTVMRFVRPVIAISRVLSLRPSHVFRLSTRLDRRLRLCVCSILLPLIALLAWMPTLLPGSVNPIVLATLTAVLVSGLTLWLPIYVQCKITVTSNSALAQVDVYVAKYILAYPSSAHRLQAGDKDLLDCLKMLQDLRQTANAAIRLPAKSLLLPILQAVTTAGTIYATYKPK